jgi:tol-pal system protein YbgF
LRPSVAEAQRGLPLVFFVGFFPSMGCILLQWRMRLILLCIALGLFSSTQTFAATPPSDAPKRFYDRVMEEFQHKDYEAALAGFRLFLELHGQNPLASSALYWLGESEYRLGRLQDAVLTFERVITRYPHSQKVASATLKKAMAYETLRMRNEARILFERVVVQFPRSPEAAAAKKALRE